MATISFIILAIFFTFVSSSNENNIVITNSGSTNTAGYVITVQPNGRCSWKVTPHGAHLLMSTTPSSTTTQTSIQLSLARTKNMFQIAQEAQPFNQYPSTGCIKSVSFGTTLHVAYNGQQTPDLSCPLKDQRLINFNNVIQELIKDLNIHTMG
ncbi:unnamed protein product [Adineta steineri]|uniref:Uncharacterized protein n=1 Tax=Adineta steineri TaxID=433720 RepID=A0A818Y7E7_9BILA|nr:unnamed protein product [Adineta steineri]CAF3749319.1 unnamed protein product [Adineta steineri]